MVAHTPTCNNISIFPLMFIADVTLDNGLHWCVVCTVLPVCNVWQMTGTMS